MVLNALGNWGYRVQSLILRSTNCFHHCQLPGITSHSHIQNNPTSETSSLNTDPQAPNQEGTSLSIRSIKLLPNMGPKFCSPRKTSLPSYSRKLRWTLIGFHLSPHPDTDSYQTFTTGPFSLLTWLHQAFLPFCTFSTGTCLRDSVPKKGGHMGPPSLLI